MAATLLPSSNFDTAFLDVFQRIHFDHLAAGAASAHPGEPNSQDDPVSRIQRLHLRILVVDDEDRFRESVVHTLRSVYESHVDQAEAASVALEKVSHGRTFDFILMDVVMPQVSGIEACQKMQVLGIRSQLVLMSAHPENRELAQSLGILFLEKPLDWEVLEKILLECGGGVAS